MTRASQVVATAAVGGLAWALAASWCGSPAEGFYVAVPLAALTAGVAGSRDLRSALRAHVRPGVSIAVGLFVIGLGLGGVFFGPAAVLAWGFWVEVATALYFLAAVVVVLLTTRRVFLAGAVALHRRGQLPAGTRRLVCEALPLALFVAVALPYGLAFSHVHRFKAPNLSDPQRALGRDFEPVEFASADGTRLRGWWVPAPSPSARTVVICHGIAANRAAFLPFAEVGDWLDANVLMFDLRGHGDSDGRSVTLGLREQEDVVAAIHYVRSARPADGTQVVGLGISLGAAALALAAAAVEPPLDGVILDSSFTSTAEMTHAAVGTFPPPVQGWLLALGLPLADLHAGGPMLRVSPEATIDRLRAPVVFLHSRGDPLIPSDHARRLHGRACQPKHLCLFELPGHCDGFFARREQYRDAVRSLDASLGHDRDGQRPGVRSARALAPAGE